MSLHRRLIRIVLTFLHGVRATVRKAAGASSDGAHALAVTEAGRIVLVLLTYAPGWRLPGGGLDRGEQAEEAVLRELREEIGLLSHGAVERVEDPGAEAAAAGDRSAFFIVRDVVYRPRWSLEVEAVREFDPEALPAGTTRGTARIVGHWRRRLRPPSGGGGGG